MTRTRKKNYVYLEYEPFWNDVSLLDAQIDFLESTLTKEVKEAMPTYYKNINRELKQLKNRKTELKG